MPKIIGLSEREKEALNHIGKGLNTSQIAQKMDITGSTVRDHLQRAVKKLNANSLAHAIAIAIIEDWI